MVLTLIARYRFAITRSEPAPGLSLAADHRDERAGGERPAEEHRLGDLLRRLVLGEQARERAPRRLVEDHADMAAARGRAGDEHASAGTPDRGTPARRSGTPPGRRSRGVPCAAAGWARIARPARAGRRAGGKPFSSHHLSVAARPKPHPHCSEATSRVSKAGYQMVVHHADRLHESVADRGPDEAETVLPQVLRQGIRHAGPRRHLPRGCAGGAGADGRRRTARGRRRGCRAARRSRAPPGRSRSRPSILSRLRTMPASAMRRVDVARAVPRHRAPRRSRRTPGGSCRAWRGSSTRRGLPARLRG